MSATAAKLVLLPFPKTMILDEDSVFPWPVYGDVLQFWSNQPGLPLS
ncbi:MAG TPA: hypothetical protein VJL89_09865 [Thermodesulfovibrionia bacterium]|nr:hypothetical protein [Thermodesulfovibrionia bacterium]